MFDMIVATTSLVLSMASMPVMAPVAVAPLTVVATTAVTALAAEASRQEALPRQPQN